MHVLTVALASFALLAASIAVQAQPGVAARDPHTGDSRGTAGATAKPQLRTPWGDPDLQGVWTGSTLTPLERPASLAGKEFLTESEAAAMEKRASERRLLEAPPSTGDPGTYNQIWFDPSTAV